jgi:hypothetical protein
LKVSAKIEVGGSEENNRVRITNTRAASSNFGMTTLLCDCPKISSPKFLRVPRELKELVGTQNGK